MGDTNELKPCPFCANDKPMIHARTCDKNDRYNPADRAYPIVRCHTCGCCAEGEDWSEPNTAVEKWNTRATPPADAAHPDDVAVDHFAAAMKAKMAASRAKGRGGWERTDTCPPGMLQGMLVDHLSKGDPVDVGNFAMMLCSIVVREQRRPPADAALGDRVDEFLTRVQNYATEDAVRDFPITAIAHINGLIGIFRKQAAALRALSQPATVAQVPAGIWMREFVDAVEREAFKMLAPNTHTPVLVGMCIEARRRLLSAAPSAKGGE